MTNFSDTEEGKEWLEEHSKVCVSYGCAITLDAGYLAGLARGKADARAELLAEVREIIGNKHDTSMDFMVKIAKNKEGKAMAAILKGLFDSYKKDLLEALAKLEGGKK